MQTDALTLERIRGSDVAPRLRAELARVVFAAPGYCRLVHDRDPIDADVDDVLHSRPPGYAEDDKHVYLIRLSDRVVGCADVLRGWKHARQSMIGLLMFDESVQRSGLGTRAVQAIEAIVRGWEGMESLRVGVNASNPGAHAFWTRMGFIETGARVKLDDYVSEAIIMEKPLR